MRLRRLALPALTALLVLSAAQSAAAEPDIVVRYPIDEYQSTGIGPFKTPDISGNGIDGFVFIADLVPGRFNKAMSTPDPGQGFNINHPTALNLQQFTVLAWIKRTDGFQYRTIVTKGGDNCGGLSSAWSLDTGSTGSLRFYVHVKNASNQVGDAVSQTALPAADISD